MPTKLRAIAPQHLPCKCCGGTAVLFGVVDFNRSCEGISQPPVPLAGIPVYFHRCSRCGFLFTTAFDDYTDEDFRREIYNDQYEQFDPEYRQLRPRREGEAVAQVFASMKELSILDYGGGSGALAQAVREHGFPFVESYDPFVPTIASRPNRRFDVIVSIEVVEHSPRPRQTFEDMISLLNDPGLILISTLFQPDDIRKLGSSWWYIAPRNGHVSLYTADSVRALVAPHGLILGSQPDRSHHVLLRNNPWFASALQFT
jgi:hypothetical protein